VNMRQQLVEVAHVDVGPADRTIEDRRRDNSGLSLLIPRQLPASPMLALPRRLEHPLNVTVQGSPETYELSPRSSILFNTDAA
jgi:hypothetical protein